MAESLRMWAILEPSRQGSAELGELRAFSYSEEGAWCERMMHMPMWPCNDYGDEQFKRQVAIYKALDYRAVRVTVTVEKEEDDG